MASLEEVHEFFGMLTANVEASMVRVAPRMAFVLVAWQRGEPGEAEGMVICGPPGDAPEVEAALITAATSLGSSDAN